MLHTNGAQPICQPSEDLKITLGALVQALHYAVDTNSDVWDFAISIRRLIDTGATEEDLRWLVRKGIVEHGR